MVDAKGRRCDGTGCCSSVPYRTALYRTVKYCKICFIVLTADVLRHRGRLWPNTHHPPPHYYYQVEKVMFCPQGPYQAPLYKYVVRGDGYPGNPDIKNFVFKVNLKCTADKPPLHWGLRGLCLLCNT